MYPDLSYLFHDLFGTSYDNGFSVIKMYGLMLALAFFCSFVVLRSELKRHATLKNFTPLVVNINNSPFKNTVSKGFVYLYAFLLGYKLGYIALHWAAFTADAGSVLLSTSGHFFAGVLTLALAIASDFIFAKKVPESSSRTLYPHDYVVHITFIAAISGILGAKLFSIVEEPSRFFADPWGTLFSGSGLTVYGGIIGGFIACNLFLKLKKIPLLRVWDSAAPALFVGYGVGRLGCHLSGDGDWGKINASPVPDWFILPDWLWAYSYPHNISRKGVAMVDCVAKYCQELSPPVFPTPLYEIIMALGLFSVLWAIRKKIKIPGLIFSIYLILNGIERFFIEFVRINKHYDFLGFNLSQAQFIALALILIGIVLSYYFIIKNDLSVKN